jgi:actin-related protein
LRSDVLGIHEIIAQSIDGGGNYNKSGNGDCSNCDIDCRRDFWRNIVLSGGTSLMKGFRDRLDNELNKITSNERKGAISRLTYATDELSLVHSVFIGLSILGIYIYNNVISGNNCQ